VRIALLRVDIDLLVVVLRIDDHRQIELLRIGFGKPGVAVGAPLHRRAHAIAVAEIDVVAHSDFVAVINDGRTGKREQKTVQ
jgi:hypothetical protein